LNTKGSEGAGCEQKANKNRFMLKIIFHRTRGGLFSLYAYGHSFAGNVEVFVIRTFGGVEGQMQLLC
jgi:hypothetical protein